MQNYIKRIQNSSYLLSEIYNVFIVYFVTWWYIHCSLLVFTWLFLLDLTIHCITANHGKQKHWQHCLNISVSWLPDVVSAEFVFIPADDDDGTRIPFSRNTPWRDNFAVLCLLASRLLYLSNLHLTQGLYTEETEKYITKYAQKRISRYSIPLLLASAFLTWCSA